MPTYEYACKGCATRFEVVQSFRDDPLQTCESCGGQLRKVFSAAGIIFKGSGYYVTDTRAESQAAAGKNGSSPNDKASDAKEGVSTEGKASGASEGGSTGGKESSDSSSGKTSGGSSDEQGA